MRLWQKLLPYLLVIGIVLGAGYSVYRWGYSEGVQKTLLEWEWEKQALRDYYDLLIDNYAARELSHRQEIARIAHELNEARREYEVALGDQRSSFEQRLLLSENRAQVYQRQAEAGAASCRDLASHAARLDRAIEEGRGLVRELGGALGLRDEQLILLGRQIEADRKLMEDTTDE